MASTVQKIKPFISRVVVLFAERLTDSTKKQALTCNDNGELLINDKRGLYPENVKSDFTFSGTAAALGTTSDVSSFGLPFTKLKFTKSSTSESATVRLAINGAGAVMFMVSGLTSETIAVTALIDGTNESAALGVVNTAGVYSAASALGNGTYRLVSQGGAAASVTVDTEIPAAAALADATANPTTPLVGAALELFNGTTWDRCRGDTTNGLDVDVTRVTGTVTVDSELPAAAALADGTANPTTPLAGAALELFNGTTWDRVRGNTEGTALASAARTTTTSSADVTNHNARGVVIAVDFTATPNNAETATVAIQAKDPVSSKYVTLTAFTALTASNLGATPTTETYLYSLYPGAAETAATAKHEVQALALPRTWRVSVTHSAGGSWTYSVGYSLIG
jgi:hypothetical protein